MANPLIRLICNGSRPGVDFVQADQPD